MSYTSTTSVILLSVRHPGIRLRLRRRLGFLRFQLGLVVDVFLVDSGLHIVWLYEATLDGVLAWPIPGTIQALLAMGLFATCVSAVLVHPGDHAAPTETILAALAPHISASVLVEERVAAGAVGEGFAGSVLCCCVNRVKPVAEFTAGFVFVLWFVAVDAGLEAAVFAAEDSAIFLGVEGLESFSAAVYASGADFELFVVSGWKMLVTLVGFSCSRVVTCLHFIPLYASFLIWSPSNVDLQNMHSIASGLFPSTWWLR
jgi:hypothetical protein